MKPSMERGCNGKANLGSRFTRQANQLAKKHKKNFGVYKCPHCGGTHITTNLENQKTYPPLLHIAFGSHNQK